MPKLCANGALSLCASEEEKCTLTFEIFNATSCQQITQINTLYRYVNPHRCNNLHRKKSRSLCVYCHFAPRMPWTKRLGGVNEENSLRGFIDNTDFWRDHKVYPTSKQEHTRKKQESDQNNTKKCRRKTQNANRHVNRQRRVPWPRRFYHRAKVLFFFCPNRPVCVLRCIFACGFSAREFSWVSFVLTGSQDKVSFGNYALGH